MIRIQPKLATNSFTRGSLRVISFVRSQGSAIKRGGLPVLTWKVTVVVRMALAVPPVLLVRALRPILLVRFGEIYTNRVGRFIEEVGQYLREVEVGIQNLKAVDIFYYRGNISNQQLKTMADREMHVHPFARWLFLVNRALPGGEKHTVKIIHTRHIGSSKFFSSSFPAPPTVPSLPRKKSCWENDKPGSWA